MQHRYERVYVETERHRISGFLTLPADGYRSRLSDFLNSADRDFISLTDCTVEPDRPRGPGHGARVHRGLAPAHRAGRSRTARRSARSPSPRPQPPDKTRPPA